MKCLKTNKRTQNFVKVNREFFLPYLFQKQDFTLTPLQVDKHYHIFNRANGTEKLFLSSDNYNFFLKKYRKHIAPVCDTLCYCLMPNHFHLLVRIRDEKWITSLENFNEEKDITAFLSKQFANLFSSYTKAFNKQVGRKGNLFIRPFKRKPIEDEGYLRKLIHYIHFNPVEAGLCRMPGDWKYSSYTSLICEKLTLLHRREVLDYFDGVENFKFVHSHPPEMNGL